MKIAFVTNSWHPEMEDDDRPLAEALVKRGALVLSASWDDPDFAWDKVDLTLLRSPWDYYRRFDEFLAWLARVEEHGTLLNPAPIVRWNAHKGYMNDLIGKGVRAVPTAFVAQGETVSLEALCAERGFDTVVLKP